MKEIIQFPILHYDNEDSHDCIRNRYKLTEEEYISIVISCLAKYGTIKYKIAEGAFNSMIWYFEVLEDRGYF